MSDIIVYNLEDDGTPTENVASQPATSTGVAGATTATAGVPSGSPATAITEGDVRTIIHQELSHYSGEFRIGALLSGQVFIIDSSGMRLGGTDFATAPFSVDYDGNLTATNGFILGNLQVGNGATYIIIDGTNSLIKSSNYVSEVSGWQIDKNGDADFNNARVRGRISTSVFVKDEVSAIGGQLLVANADVLAVDMTALDASTLTIKGDSTFAVNDMLHIKDGVDEEYLRVTSIASAPQYSVTRDLAGAYASNSNPAWKEGTAVVVEGSSDGASTFSGGFLKLLGAGVNSPKYSVFKRTGAAYNAITEYATLGNLNSRLDYVTDEYGVAIGTLTSGYLAYDETNGLRTNGKVISQQIFTTGIAIDAGSPAAIESDGLLYRTRATDFSTKNTELALGTATSNAVTFANRLYNLTSTRRALFYCPTGGVGSTLRLGQIVVSPTSSSVTSVTLTTLNETTDAREGHDAVMITASDAVVAWQQGSSIRARYVSSVDATVSLGAGISIGAFGSRPSIVKVSATEFLVIYSNGNNLQATSVSISGTTLTAGSTYTILSNGKTNRPIFAERFGTSTSYALIFNDTTDTKAYIMAFSFAGTTLTAGTPVQVVSHSGAAFDFVMKSGYLTSTTSTQMGACMRFDVSGGGGGGDAVYLYTYNLSGVTLTLGVQTVVENIGAVLANSNQVTLSKISNYTYAVGYADSTTSTVGRLYHLAGNTFTVVGGELTHTGLVANTAIPNIFCYHSPTRILLVGTSSTSANGFAKTVDFTTNYSGTVGVITSATALGANALTILNGENVSVSGLTVGTEYYADLDGALTTAALGGTKRIGVAGTTSSKIIVQV